MVKQSWGPDTGKKGMMNLCRKMHRLKIQCSFWNREVFGNIFHNTTKAKLEADDLEKKFFNDPSPSNLSTHHYPSP